MELSNYSKIFKALGNEQRLRIYLMMVDEWVKINCGKDECCGLKGQFTKAVEKMNLSKSTISHHFKELENAGLISCRKEGQLSVCTINSGVIEELKDLLNRF